MGGWGGGWGGVASASVRVTMSGGRKAPAIFYFIFMSLGVHFTANKNDYLLTVVSGSVTKA